MIKTRKARGGGGGGGGDGGGGGGRRAILNHSSGEYRISHHNQVYAFLFKLKNRFKNTFIL